MGEYADMAVEQALAWLDYDDEEEVYYLANRYRYKSWKETVKERAKDPLFKDIMRLKKEGKL